MLERGIKSTMVDFCFLFLCWKGPWCSLATRAALSRSVAVPGEKLKAQGSCCQGLSSYSVDIKSRQAGGGLEDEERREDWKGGWMSKKGWALVDGGLVDRENQAREPKALSLE